MTRIGKIYVAGTVSTIFTLLSTVANGVFATAISRTLSDLGGLQVASVTGCALSCLIQGFLVFLFRERIKKGFRLRRKLECWLLVVVGFILCLMVVVEAMAIRWSSLRLGDIENAIQRREAGKLFSVWCALWAVSVFSQATCYGILIYMDRKSGEKEPDWEVSTLRGRRSASRRLNDEETGILTTSPEVHRSLDPRVQEKLSSESSSISNARFSRLSKEYTKVNRDQSVEPVNHRMSTDSHPWVQRFSRRVPGLHDELRKLDAEEQEQEDELACRQSKTSSRHRTSRDQSPDSLFERPIMPDARSIIRTPSPALSIASSLHCGSGAAEVPQDRIHPLFRSDSPSAPPFVSPGTNVTASPLAGHTISIEILNQIRSRSSLARPRSRSLLGHLKEDEEEEDEDDDCWRASVSGIRRPSPVGYPSSIYGSGRAFGSRTSLHDYGNRKSSGGQVRSGRRGSSLPPCR